MVDDRASDSDNHLLGGCASLKYLVPKEAKWRRLSE